MFQPYRKKEYEINTQSPDIDSDSDNTSIGEEIVDNKQIDDNALPANQQQLENVQPNIERVDDVPADRELRRSERNRKAPQWLREHYVTYESSEEEDDERK